MTILNIKFKSNGETVKKTAMFKSIGNNPELSNSKKNDAYDANLNSENSYTSEQWTMR